MGRGRRIYRLDGEKRAERLTYVAIIRVLVAVGLAFFKGFGCREPEIRTPRCVDAVEVVFAAVDFLGLALVSRANRLGATCIARGVFLEDVVEPKRGLGETS